MMAKKYLQGETMRPIFRIYIPLFLLITLLSCILLMCTVPPVSRDALTHHLAVPKLYVQQGGINELPGIIFSYYPQLLDLLYCIPLMVNNDILPKYIHFSFALLTAFSIYRYTQKKMGLNYAFFAVLFFLSLPVIVKLSITVYVDLGLIFFTTASLLCLLKWHEAKKEIFYFVLSAVFCGLALSTKYNGLISLFLLTSFTPIVYLKGLKKNSSSQFKSLGFGVLFFLISISVFSPWMIKNYIWTKNPVYPLYNNFFNSKEVSLKEKLILKKVSKPTINHFLVRKYVYKEKWWETILTPVRIFFQGEDDNPKFFDGKLNPLLFILPIFAFINFRPSKTAEDFFERKVLFSFSFLYIMAVFFRLDMRIRWIGCAIPPLVILSAYGVKNLYGQIKDHRSKHYDKGSLKYSFYISIVSILILFLMSLNGLYLYRLFGSVDPLPYLSRQITREAYIEKFRPEFAALNFSNLNLDDNTKLLALFLGGRRYYSDHEIIFKRSGFRNIIRKANTSNDILVDLKARKFSDIVLNYKKFNNWINTNCSNREKKLIQDFFNLSVDSLFSKGGYGLYHLK